MLIPEGGGGFCALKHAQSDLSQRCIPVRFFIVKQVQYSSCRALLELGPGTANVLDCRSHAFQSTVRYQFDIKISSNKNLFYNNFISLHHFTFFYIFLLSFTFFYFFLPKFTVHCSW